ncbi:MAG: helix-turn-helix domain-containing protein [Ktedonobacteraceae bacterium]
MSALERELIAAADSERAALNQIEGVLENLHRVPKLVFPDGEEIELPHSVFRVLRQLVYHLAHNRAVTIIPINKELTTQEAADILNVSRPYLVKLLEQGEIPFTRTGTHRRIRFSDLTDYKKMRDTTRRRGLAELTQLSQELGLYDV